MDTYSYEDYIYTVMGFVGVSMATIAVIPNIVRVTRRFKSRDISYTYQIMLGTGILWLAIYYVYYKSVLAFPLFLSATLNYYMAGLKFYIEMVYTPREAMAVDCIEDTEHKSLLGDDERSKNERESPKGYGTKSHNTL